MPSSLATSGTAAPAASFASAWRSLRTICSGECRLPIKSPPYAHLGLSDSHSNWTRFWGAGHDVVRFLKHLLHQIPGKLLIIWDGSPIHRSRAVKDSLASGASSRVQLEQLPGYAPDLNPDEGVWKHLKCVELKNLCCQSLAQLRVELRKAKERLRHKKHVILGCMRQPGFEV